MMVDDENSGEFRSPVEQVTDSGADEHACA